VADQPAAQAQRPGRAARAAERRASSQAETARGRGAQAVAAPARPGPRPRTGAPWRIPGRAAGPKPAAQKPAAPQPTRTTGPQSVVAAPTRTTGPQPALSPSAAQSARSAIAGSNRMPFVLLLCGLLGGALISALVISTTLAAGSFQISKLQDSTASLAKQRQVLQEQVAQQQSAQTIAQQATQLGMRRNGELRYVDLKTGKTTNDGPTWSGAAEAPGYAP
jgi:hypothetical protein